MLIFDIGANNGSYSIANMNNNTVIAVEASTITYETLKNNVKNHSNIIPINYAVTSENAEYLKFYHCVANTISTLDYDWLSSEKSRFGNYKNSITEIQVPTITIDKMIELYGKPSLIKIDVEGYENITIKSLNSKVDELCFEWAAEWRDKCILAIEHLTSIGFTKFHIQIKDEYTYRPNEYSLSAKDTIDYLLYNTVDKEDFGMIWCI